MNTRMYDSLAVLLLLVSLAPCAADSLAASAVRAHPVDQVWSGHPVAFALLTDPPWQYVGYYNAQRQMVIAMRTLDSEAWTPQVLDETVGWDSHNSIQLALDEQGCLHVSGNMHVHPLKYFRTREPHDVRTLERVSAMTGREEDRVTYPCFLRGPGNQLLFKYRDGSSGAGNEIYNVYDTATRTWRRFLDTPLVDGEGERNAYFDGPRAGPDGFYHLCWVWRDTPDCASNHSLSYARSKDLLHWENSRGETCPLPILYATGEVVDPAPPGGGLINGNVRMGFDAQGRVVLSFHKYDAQGLSQLYNARPRDGAWEVVQLTHWAQRWAFSGGGAIEFEVRVGPVKNEPDGRLTQTWSSKETGQERWRIDSETLLPVEKLELPPPKLPAELARVRSSFPGMRVQTAADAGTPPGRYLLRWETLGPNRDKPRPEPWPEPSVLELIDTQ